MTRAVADSVRFVPFSALLAAAPSPPIPILLLAGLRVWPGMLPSTFDDPARVEDQYAKRLAEQSEITRDLRNALGMMAARVSKEAACAETRKAASELATFVLRVRAVGTGAVLAPGQFRRFMKLFQGELGFDKMARRELLAMAHLFGAGNTISLATDEGIRRRLRLQLRQLRRDDTAIQQEGVDALSQEEVVEACRARGIPAPASAPAAILLWVGLSSYLSVVATAVAPVTGPPVIAALVKFSGAG
jgi:LETM1 and EF-hand domain-containing protein 1